MHSPNGSEQKPTAKLTQARRLLELGQGLELWETPVDELREQDKNARVLGPAAFERLQATVGRDSRLESLPFVAMTDRGLEIVSGHHRARVARAAGLKSIYALVDVTGLTPSQIAAKQLAHNTINGYDDAQLLKQIYESIEDVDSRLEAFVDPKALDLELAGLQVGNVNLDFEHRVMTIAFLPSELEAFQKACEAVLDRLTPDQESVYVAEIDKLDQFKTMVQAISQAIEVKAYGTILGVCADIVLQALGEQDETDKTDRVHLSELVKQTYIPRDAADIVTQALDRMTKLGLISDVNRWQGLEFLAADYLAGWQQPTTDNGQAVDQLLAEEAGENLATIQPPV